ncbi:hypothetical protein [Nitrospirillum amazonense]|uniref:hypothetical protein n=1 Tax=Nitrospirillum amazonense TaxID=28077 RepID=UPI00241272D8|nr:hypothetical protein [Nitrospirillum amazonense]MDG3444693.1 hypothetical protein [Nitrospirillum amazonense]
MDALERHKAAVESKAAAIRETRLAVEAATYWPFDLIEAEALRHDGPLDDAALAAITQRICKEQFMAAVDQLAAASPDLDVWLLLMFHLCALDFPGARAAWPRCLAGAL